MFPLYPNEALQSLKLSGIYALSAPEALEAALTGAGMSARDSVERETPIAFEAVDDALRAFMGAGPTRLAIDHSGEKAVADAIREALAPFTDADGRITLPSW
ncbi:MAG TPA: hypothetical protein VNA28_11935 [Solirubrobacteraceae bacterium]|nr:hypothetical protein [Solirubrobacteraceae bacterium]